VIHPAAERLSQLLRRHVVEIYGEGDADALTERVLDEAQLTGHTPTPGTAESKWDEGDVMVITYGDSIISPSEAPLRSLNRFLARELRNTINGVHILPFFPYSSDDGFSIVDYYAVNPELGGWEDVEAIASEYKLMADLVINHCSSQSQWFQNYLQDKSPGRGFFIEPSPDTDLSQVVRPRATPLLTRVETVKGKRQVWCTFSSDQVDLNFANPEVLFETIRILRDYLAHGILYFRLDAIAYLWKEPGTSCVHLSQTHDIIKLLRLVLENLDHRVVVITETNVPNRENLSYFGNDNEAHLIYNFSLPPLLLHALLTGDCQHLKTWMMSMPPARRGRGYFNFIASHDGIGVRPTEGLLSEQELADMLGTLESFGGSVSVRRMPDGQDKPYEVNISLYDALKGTIASGADAHQMERFFCAHTIVLALEGIPGIYIHSLLGTENDHNLKAETGRARSINRHRWDADALEAALADPGRHHGALFSELKRRINIRRGQEAFHPNATQYTLHFGDGIFAFWRESLSRSQSIFALHNVTDQVQQLSLVELNLIGTDTWRDLLSDTAYDDLHAIIEIPPYGALWISN
jgi:sucrose phosphorylase